MMKFCYAHNVIIHTLQSIFNNLQCMIFVIFEIHLNKLLRFVASDRV